MPKQLHIILGTEHHCEYLSVDDLLQLMPTFREEFDEPFFDSSAFPVMAVSRLARRHVTVSLSGDGGDELFGGYHYYQIAQRLNPFLVCQSDYGELLHPLWESFQSISLSCLLEHYGNLIAPPHLLFQEV